MLFEKSIKTFLDIRNLKNAETARIKKQQKELKDLLPFEASIGQSTKLAEMCYNLDQDVESINIITDEKSESLINEYIYTLLNDFIVKRDEDNNLIFNLKIKEI